MSTSQACNVLPLTWIRKPCSTPVRLSLPYVVFSLNHNTQLTGVLPIAHLMSIMFLGVFNVSITWQPTERYGIYPYKTCSTPIYPEAYVYIYTYIYIHYLNATYSPWLYFVVPAYTFCLCWVYMLRYTRPEGKTHYVVIKIAHVGMSIKRRQ